MGREKRKFVTVLGDEIRDAVKEKKLIWGIAILIMGALTILSRLYAAITGIILIGYGSYLISKEIKKDNRKVATQHILRSVD